MAPALQEGEGMAIGVVAVVAVVGGEVAAAVRRWRRRQRRLSIFNQCLHRSIATHQSALCSE